VNGNEDIVQLVSEVGVVVGSGVIDGSITCGIELHHVKLWPHEVAVRVQQVVDENIWIGELVGERLGQ